MALVVCDHQHFMDLNNGKMFMACFCFCDQCWDQVAFVTEGSGCIDADCYCRNLEGECRTAVATHVYDNNHVYLPSIDDKPVTQVVSDLPEQPGKTGTCRVCKEPTYRKGTRGRFPVLCDEHKT